MVALGQACANRELGCAGASGSKRNREEMFPGPRSRTAEPLRHPCSLLSVTFHVSEIFLLTCIAEPLDDLGDLGEQRVDGTFPSSSPQTEGRERRHGVPGKPQPK